MKLKPDDSWQWHFDPQEDRVMLSLNEGLVFRSCYPSKMLVADAFHPQPFCINDAALYQTFEENCLVLPLSAEQRAMLVLNGIVAGRFLKPQMPKSWHFLPHSRSWQPEVASLVEATLSYSQQKILLLVVEPGEQASLCVLAQPGVCLASGKMLGLGEVIKVMNDRLAAYRIATETYLVKAC